MHKDYASCMAQFCNDSGCAQERTEKIAQTLKISAEVKRHIYGSCLEDSSSFRFELQCAGRRGRRNAEIFALGCPPTGHLLHSFIGT